MRQTLPCLCLLAAALLAAAEKRRLEMDPTDGAEMEGLAKEVMAASPDVVKRVEALLGGK